MGDANAPNSGRGRQPVLTETLVHIRIPENRLFMCGTEPPSVPAMLEALKLFIREVSGTIFKLEIERKV
jgi:hypothetical protein